MALRKKRSGVGRIQEQRQWKRCEEPATWKAGRALRQTASEKVPRGEETKELKVVQSYFF